MRDGYRIIDTDTHVGPTADVLYEYGSDALQRATSCSRTSASSATGSVSASTRIHATAADGREGRRRRGRRGGVPALKERQSNKSNPEPGVSQRSSTGRLADMDREGRDVD
jgi:hypothetical protein